jgi:hypothetical protein
LIGREREQQQYCAEIVDGVEGFILCFFTNMDGRSWFLCLFLALCLISDSFSLSLVVVVSSDNVVGWQTVADWQG